MPIFGTPASGLATRRRRAGAALRVRCTGPGEGSTHEPANGAHGIRFGLGAARAQCFARTARWPCRHLGALGTRAGAVYGLRLRGKHGRGSLVLGPRPRKVSGHRAGATSSERCGRSVANRAGWLRHRLCGSSKRRCMLGQQRVTRGWRGSAARERRTPSLPPAHLVGLAFCARSLGWHGPHVRVARGGYRQVLGEQRPWTVGFRLA